MLVLYRAIRLVGDTTHREPESLIVAACRIDTRGIQVHTVGVATQVDRSGPIVAVGTLIVVPATAHVAGKSEIYRTRPSGRGGVVVIIENLKFSVISTSW